MTKWREDRFQTSMGTTIQHLGGRSDRIENRQSPGNADLLYSLNGRMGVIELKATVFFNRDRKIRLKHPLTSDQRRFLREHGKRSGLAFVAVLLSHDIVADNRAILFRWDELDVLDNEPTPMAELLAAWAGKWPCPTPEDLRSFQETITGVKL